MNDTKETPSGVIEGDLSIKTNPSESTEIVSTEGDKNKKRYNSQTEKMFKLHKKGYSVREAYEKVKGLSEVSEVSISHFRTKFKEWLLTNEKTIKLAHKAVNDTLQLKTVNGVTPSATNRLTAAQMVFDRIDPVTKQVEHNHQVQFHPVDLSKYELSPSNTLASNTIEDEISEEYQIIEGEFKQVF